MARRTTNATSALVSCIMPTRNRPRFLRQAIRCFLRQTYQPAELIVVDDGDRFAPSVAARCSRWERVRYIHLPERTPAGAKLNLGIRHARGQILQKLDDDDYYHPDFLNVAVAHLLARSGEPALVTWDCFLVLLAGDGRPRFTGHGWTAGGTLCFARTLWERAKFREVPVDEDYFFLRDHRRAITRVCSPEHYILVRHGRNTWTRWHDGKAVDEQLRNLPFYPKPLPSLVHPADLAFYQSLRYRER